jgi:hypothetical protein
MKNKTTLLIVLSIILIAVNLLVPHTDEIATKKTLEINNFKVVKVGGYNFWAGNKYDWYKTKFMAIAPNGDTITGTVTKGLFSKENVIRLKN